MFSANQKEKSCCGNSEYTDLANKAGQKLREVVDLTADEARDTTAIIVRQMRSNPIQSSAIAVGIGMLVGLLLRRR